MYQKTFIGKFIALSVIVKTVNSPNIHKKKNNYFVIYLHNGIPTEIIVNELMLNATMEEFQKYVELKELDTKE